MTLPLDKRQTFQQLLESFKELLRWDARSWVHSKFHLTDLFVDLLHEMYYEVHQLVFVHLLSVEVCDQEADVITLTNAIAATIIIIINEVFSLWYYSKNTVK